MSAKPVRISLALGALVPALVAATIMTPLDVQPESKLWIAGTSTVRAFQCQAATFDAKLGATGTNAVSAVLAGEKVVSDIVVTVPAEKLDCRNGTMNEHMRKALKVAQFPTITFRVASYDLAKAADGVNVTLTGALTLGGVEKPITIDATAKPGENGTLLVSGTREIRMTEFGLKPPTLMLGTMKVDERIKVGFDVVLKD
jgi:polyisoprenoid-binding protein YceI